jgi:hypothetical protein
MTMCSAMNTCSDGAISDGWMRGGCTAAPRAKSNWVGTAVTNTNIRHPLSRSRVRVKHATSTSNFYAEQQHTIVPKELHYQRHKVCCSAVLGQALVIQYCDNIQKTAVEALKCSVHPDTSRISRLRVHHLLQGTCDRSKWSCTRFL